MSTDLEGDRETRADDQPAGLPIADRVIEMRDTLQAREYLLEGLWLTRTLFIDDDSLPRILQWAMEISNEGSPLLPLGLIADIGQVLTVGASAIPRSKLEPVPGVDPSIMRRYEDYVIGKVFADGSVERAGHGLLRHDESVRNRGVAFAIEQIRQRCGLGGIRMSPATIKFLAGQEPEVILAARDSALQDHSVSGMMRAAIERISAKVRMTGDLLGSEDVFELERGTAVKGFGQRIALRQILRAADDLVFGLPRYRPSSSSRRQAVRANIHDEDVYPVGGFSSIANKGTMESLLRSELAYIDDHERPDLFDIRYVRDELLYYARDENQFFRQRMNYIFFLRANLVSARFKDPDLPWQRIVFILATVRAAILTLMNWLGEHSLHFEIHLELKSGQKLDEEKTLLETLFAEEVSTGFVSLHDSSLGDLQSDIPKHSKISLCQTLVVSDQSPKSSERLEGFHGADEIRWMVVNGPEPQAEWLVPAQFALSPIENWRDYLSQLLRAWM